MQKTKYKNKKYCNSLHNKECSVPGCRITETTCGHHIIGRLRDDIQIPLCYDHHTGANGIHWIGKQTWYDKYLNKETCLEIAKKNFDEFLTEGR